MRFLWNFWTRVLLVVLILILIQLFSFWPREYKYSTNKVTYKTIQGTEEVIYVRFTSGLEFKYFVSLECYNSISLGNRLNCY